MAAAQPLPVALRRILLVTVKAGIWSELAALRRHQRNGLLFVSLVTGVPLAVLCSVFCAVVLSGGRLISVLFGLGALICWLFFGLLLKLSFAVALVLGRWIHPSTSFFHAVRTDEGIAVEHFHRLDDQLVGAALVVWPPGHGLGLKCQREVRSIHPGPITGTATNKWLMTNYYHQTSDRKSRSMRWEAKRPDTDPDRDRSSNRNATADK